MYLDPSKYPEHASERGWERLRVATRKQLRKAERDGELLVCQPGKRKKQIWRDDLERWLEKTAEKRLQGGDHLERLRQIRDGR